MKHIKFFLLAILMAVIAAPLVLSSVYYGAGLLIDVVAVILGLVGFATKDKE